MVAAGYLGARELCFSSTARLRTVDSVLEHLGHSNASIDYRREHLCASLAEHAEGRRGDHSSATGVAYQRHSMFLQQWRHNWGRSTFFAGSSADECRIVGIEQTYGLAWRHTPHQYGEIHIHVRVPHGLRLGKAVGP